MPIKIYSTDKIEIEKAVLYWIELLAEGKYDEAYLLTLHDPYYQWSPADIKSVINGYGLPDEMLKEKYRVTAPDTAIINSNIHPYKGIELYDDSAKRRHSLHSMTIIGDVCYDLPINGEWSDLSVTFKILQKDNFIMLELNEIHVF
ncbi:hypothetical protein MTO98_05510 [Mucilaginibacter sp. SMC90]|uniref:hypothetical protein n=1 Tax=Mucilaginibacter sp. SMC90 TaxID=2929803 RepID=UPI001FB543AA|nr:hypothetical protein [Mucilaginibacter sp. SMC90]UOE50530.1 hypothetical protein MTO98_05510 [Mucilaginibacter sp. SMC90]